MTKLVIVGAGIAGLFAARLLKHHDPLVVEAQPSLPNNHSAVLRFRSAIVGEALGIEFKKVKVIKAVLPWRNPVADVLAYSRKTGGVMRTDRSINTADAQFVDRWIAPSDLLNRMSQGIHIEYNTSLSDLLNRNRKEELKIISTIPMPALMTILKYPERIPFYHNAGVNVKATLPNCDAYVSLYVPDPDLPFSRISLTGDEMISECSNLLGMEVLEVAQRAAAALGIPNISIPTEHKQKYAKILPIDESARRSFIFWASQQHNIFSLGRFATWRPGLLTDDLVKDIKFLDGLISSKSIGYDLSKHGR